MKNITLYLLLFLIVCCKDRTVNPVSAGYAVQDDSTRYHFRILDSSAAASSSDTLCISNPASIEYMELRTGILTTYESTYLGKIFFSKQTLALWHQWYGN